MTDWADDVTELADALGLETFSVSGGSSKALARWFVEPGYQAVKRLAEKVPKCQSKYLRDAGHLLIDYPHVVEAVTKVLSGGELND